MDWIKVTCAIIRIENKVLAVQRSEKMNLPLKWEFPGGKMEADESEEDCILREIKEELNLKIRIRKRLTPTKFSYPNINIELLPFFADYISGELILIEHKQHVLLEIKDLMSLDWAEADIPVVMELIKFSEDNIDF